MANNNVQWSEIIPQLTRAETTWVETVLIAAQHYLDEDEADTVAIPQPLLDTLRDTQELFEWKIETATEGPLLWLYSEGEAGNTNTLASFVQEFLRKFRPTQDFALTWAAWCSKLRAGEFSGGALYVTAESIRHCDAEDIITRWRRERSAP